MLDSPGRFLFQEFPAGAGPQCWLRARSAPVETISVAYRVSTSAREAVDTLAITLHQSQSPMAFPKIPDRPDLEEGRQPADIYLVTRLYSEALNSMVILRKSAPRRGANRVRAERAGSTQKFPGFPPLRKTEIVLASDRPNFHLYHVIDLMDSFSRNGSPNSTPIIWP